MPVVSSDNSKLSKLDNVYESMFNKPKARATQTNTKAPQDDLHEFSQPAQGSRADQNTDQSVSMLSKLAAVVLGLPYLEQLLKDAGVLPQIKLPGTTSAPMPIKSEGRTGRG